MAIKVDGGGVNSGAKGLSPPRQPEYGLYRPKHVAVPSYSNQIHLSDIVVFDYIPFPSFTHTQRG